MIGNDAINDSGQVAMLVTYVEEPGGAERIAIVRADPVLDITPPEIEVPDDIFAEATGPQGAILEYAVVATDTQDPNPAIECSHPSGALFGLGETRVACTATDASGNSASGSFTVSVSEASHLQLMLPGPISAEATSADGAVIVYAATAADPIHANPVVACLPASGSTFPLDVTTVQCTATDSVGIVVNGSFTVKVSDTTPPTIVAQAPAIDAFESNGLAYSVLATDIVDPSPSVACVPPVGSTVTPGQSVPVSCTATDARGNSAMVSFTVTVLSLDALVELIARDVETLNLELGLTKSLVTSLRLAASALRGHTSNPQLALPACGHLAAFEREMIAQAGKAVPANDAQQLIERALRVWRWVGCATRWVLAKP
jgi:HYR domain